MDMSLSAFSLFSVLQKINIVSPGMDLCTGSRSCQCLAINPQEHHLVAVSSLFGGTSLYDTRMKKRYESYMPLANLRVHGSDNVNYYS